MPIINNKTDKDFDIADARRILGFVFNPRDASLTTNGFLAGMVGRKVLVEETAPENLDGAAVGDDITYTENGDLLYKMRILYADGDRNVLISGERIE